MEVDGQVGHTIISFREIGSDRLLEACNGHRFLTLIFCYDCGLHFLIASAMTHIIFYL